MLDVSRSKPAQQSLFRCVGEVNTEIGAELLGLFSKILSLISAPASEIQDNVRSDDQRPGGHIPKKRLEYLMPRIVSRVSGIVLVGKIVTEQANVPLVRRQP